MKKFFILILVVLRINLTFGQQSSSDSSETFAGKNKEFVLSGYGSLIGQSNELNAGFVKKILFGGTLSATVNDKIWERLNVTNQLIGHSSMGIAIKTSIDTSENNHSRFFCVQWERSNWNHLSFSRDAFGLVFLGNAPFLGQELQFSNTSFEQLNYQKMGLGFQNESKGFSVWLNLVDGINYQSFVVNNAKMKTDSSAAFVDFNYQITSLNSPLKNSGIGLALDFDFHKQKGDVKWDICIKDLGWVTFKSVESNIWTANDRFTGWQFSDQLGMDTNQTNQWDSWFEPNTQTISQRVVLPTMLNVGLKLRKWGYRVKTYCFERQLGWQTLYYGESYIPLKNGYLGYELALNRTFRDRHALSGEFSWMSNSRNTSFSISMSELPGFLMSNSRQLMFQFSLQKRIF